VAPFSQVKEKRIASVIKKFAAYLLILASAGLFLFSMVMMVAGIATASETLGAMGVFVLSLGLYLYYFSRTQLINSKQMLHLEISGGFAAPKWVSWLLSISTLLVGLVVATNKEISIGEDWKIKFVPLLFISLLGAIAATSRRRKL
jgi:hypothetical protein